jgi:hypothetical protein
MENIITTSISSLGEASPSDENHVLAMAIALEAAYRSFTEDSGSWSSCDQAMWLRAARIQLDRATTTTDGG